MAYLIDSDVFISAQQRHYSMEFCPAFWDWLKQANALGLVLSVPKIFEELTVGSGPEVDWAVALKDDLFVKPTPKTLAAYATVSTWANSQDYTQAAIAEFLSAGEYFLIGEALAGGHVVVTHEVPRNTKNKVKIPNACAGVGVQCMSPFRMLKQEKALFVLG